jgi:hypothetical protein
MSQFALSELLVQLAPAESALGVVLSSTAAAVRVATARGAVVAMAPAGTVLAVGQRVRVQYGIARACPAPSQIYAL